MTPQGHHYNHRLWPKSGKNGQKWRYFGFISTSGDAIGAISIQQLDNVVIYRLRYLNHARCAQIWQKSPKSRQHGVAAGRKSRSRQFLDSSVTGFRYLIKSWVLGGLVGSATHVLWARVCGCGGPTLSPWPACPVGAACRGGGGGPSPGGVACHRCEGRLVSGAVPPPVARPLERAARVPRPVCPGCGRCGCGDPAPASQRAHLRAGVARCGGGGRASPGGVLSTIVRGVWGQAPSLPRLPAHWAGCWGPPPTCCGRGCVAVGAQHCPRGLHALWGLHAAGVVGGRPRGGWPATIVRGAWCQALSLPRPPVLWTGQPGFRVPCVPGAVGAGVGTPQRPHSVRPCGLALLAVGVAEGRPLGGCLPPL